MFSRFRLRYALPVVGLIVTVAVLVAAFAMNETVLGKEQADRLTGEGDVTLSETSISPEEAVKAAQAVATGPLDGVEVEQLGDRVVYEVEIGDSEVQVDPTDGSIIDVATEENDDDRDEDDRDEDDRGDDVRDGDDRDDDAGEALGTPAIAIDDAVAIAKGASSGSVGDIELDQEDGRLVYEIEVGSDEVIIDANDGSVLSVHADD